MLLERACADLSNQDKDFININNRLSQFDDDFIVDDSTNFDDDNNEKDCKKTTEKDKKKKIYLGVRIAAGVLALVFIIAGCLSFWFYKDIINSSNYVSIDNKTNANKDNTQVKVTTPEGEEYTVPENDSIVYGDGNLLSNDYVLNIMLFGADRYGDQGLSDTMILLSIDNHHKKIKMTSFLRDTYVNIPGYYPHKLNLAYALDGAGLAISTIEANYGIQIDRYATVNFSTFKKIVDILGGIELYVTDNEIGYINAQIAYNGQSSYLYASEGMVTLNGQQALWYARNRGGTFNGITYGGDDWDRTDRQRNFLEAVITNVKDASISELIQIVNSVGPNITTNLKKTEIQALLTKALTYLNYDIEQCHMPSDGTWSYGWNDAGSVILVNDWDAARRDLAEFIYEDLVVDAQ